MSVGADNKPNKTERSYRQSENQDRRQQDSGVAHPFQRVGGRRIGW